MAGECVVGAWILVDRHQRMVRAGARELVPSACTQRSFIAMCSLKPVEIGAVLDVVLEYGLVFDCAIDSVLQP